ncbi:bifunctional 3-phenylpropionate/cinnamic acid dioxygenase ferredoxin subunit [Streptomyces sp. NBC_00117]|uniref:Bifunctional 3-phenylpropionate/cinnamic acid dioxygenase ferredoxin subunit n=1 Tax=Streptomyces sp. NBC_00119 TaxID=2975659 RepID=A0AAU1U5L9_9ACTN|nr:MULTISPECIES: bifunctional 3-phenylpropionate/cinnamic acid dioxygenase ferredoxin subunit [unclassified Streptomyces]MCX5435601.1 bifunctional 3-phenylpropionate/cinnamic acid dioxygenase ferredoxin subunit [Streptomyces sp. NBC_00063]WSE08866.1 bifunctional 3-phenylpropionate/cinnamic acid dioxygenase ferredoxin subunit [Streptomyces sp. NBC_01445]
MIQLCSVEELTPGTVTRIARPDLPAPLALVKVGDRVFCIDDTCSHETASLSDGWLDGHEVECPLHESRFDVRTGRPDCPPARRSIRTHAVQLVDGIVYVEESSVAAEEPAR